MSKIFDSIKVSDEVKRFVDHSFDVVDQIHDILEKQGKTQRDLAAMLGKKESEISKWMQGTHNFTLKSISKIEAVLGESILITPRRAKSKYAEVKFVPIKSFAKPNKPDEANSIPVVEASFTQKDPKIFKTGLKSA